MTLPCRLWPGRRVQQGVPSPTRGRTALWAAWTLPSLCSVRRNSAQHHPTCPWSLGLNLPFCVWKQPQHHGAPQGTPLPLPSSVEEPGGRASGPVQQLQQESPSTSAPFHPPEPPCSPLGTGPRWGPARYQLTSGTSSPVSLPCRQNLSTVEPTTQTRAIAE